MEFCAGIPGSVGGAVRMNAGAYGKEIKDVVDTVELMIISGEIMSSKKDDLKFAYRNLDISEGTIIIGASFLLTRGIEEQIHARINEILGKRKNKHPLEYRNAGSIFKNPNGGIPAGRIIDELGLKGIRIGNAKISEKHGNFIVNLGNAKASDIIALIDMIKTKVNEERGINVTDRGHDRRGRWMKNPVKSRLETKKYRLQRRSKHILHELLRTALLLGVISIVGAVMIFGYNFTISSPYFQIKEIIVHGCKELTEKEILSYAAIKPSQNLLAINLGTIARRIESNPWVKEVLVGKEFPNRLIIDLQERTAVALVKNDNGFNLLDLDGVAFKKLEKSDEADIPVLNGCYSDDSDSVILRNPSNSYDIFQLRKSSLL